MMKKVALVFTGGTISMKFDPKLNAVVPMLSGEDILAMVKGIEKYAEVEYYTFSTLPGPHITPKIMMEISKCVKSYLDREDISGVVVTHGTDDLEETAYLMDLTIKSEKPVVVTGSMKNSSELGFEGPANLFASICTAAAEESRNRGVLVVMNGMINCANEVTKSNTTSIDTFKSPGFGPIGIVDNNQVMFYRNSVYRQYININDIETRVDLIKCASGMDSKLINYCIDKGAKGIVIEAMGRGNIPPDMVEGVENAIKNGVAVVLVSRCYEGRVLGTYGYPGGGKLLKDLGVIFGERIPGQKARIKLMVALSSTKDINKVREIFEEANYNTSSIM